jgi:DNA-binding CsgD family transcriptional regulator
VKKKVSIADDHALVLIFPDLHMPEKVLIFSLPSDELAALLEVKKPTAKNPFEKLSAKERLLVHYYLKGHTSTEIKKILRLHASTVGTLKTRLFAKLNIKSLVALAELARVHCPDLDDQNSRTVD